MRHTDAREALGAFLDSKSFGSRALALSQVAWLGGHPQSNPDQTKHWFSITQALPEDEVCSDGSDASSGLSMPEDAAGLAAQCCELVIDRPSQAGVVLARTAALVDLWPHASRAERVQLRRLWYRGLCQCSAPDGSYATRRELREWQSRLPTIHDDDTPTPNVLAGMFETTDPERAYHTLAAQLGPHSDVPRLAAIMGGLAARLVLHNFDRHGVVQNAMLGATALSRISGQVPMGTALTLLCQIAHRVWWCHHHAGLKALEPGNQDRELSLCEAVQSADYTAAQRAARLLAADPAAWWSKVFVLLDSFAATDSKAWIRALNAVVIACQRGGDQAVAPDDAAALGASLAAATWLTPSHQH
ncbi:MAG: hypothetical protein PF961_21220 [Planctomycetota bacterium]|nr:hypothetical protein [Planctomycetota bacterium]